MYLITRNPPSNLKINDGTNDASAATTFAVDISGFYQSEEVAYTDFNGRWRAGFNLQNMGPKISYDNDDLNDNFMPANLRLGVGFDFIFDENLNKYICCSFMLTDFQINIIYVLKK